MRKSTEAKTALTQPKVKERVRPNSDEPLAEVQKALKKARVEVKRERERRLQAERALTEARAELAAPLEIEHGHQAQIRRVSFVVRLTLDEHGQFERTEIEHVSSSRKQNFKNLDGKLLVAFMKACMNAEINQEDTISTISPEKR